MFLILSPLTRLALSGNPGGTGRVIKPLYYAFYSISERGNFSF